MVMARVFRGVDDYGVDDWEARVSGLSASCTSLFYINGKTKKRWGARTTRTNSLQPQSGHELIAPSPRQLLSVIQGSVTGAGSVFAPNSRACRGASVSS
jgi:hypothetical protein